MNFTPVSRFPAAGRGQPPPNLGRGQPPVGRGQSPPSSQSLQRGTSGDKEENLVCFCFCFVL